MSISGRDAPSVLIKEACPLRVDEVFLADPVLTLTGTKWNLTVWCAWSVAGLGFDWESDDLAERVGELRGAVVTDFHVVPDRGPVFVLEGPLALVLNERDVDEPIGLDDPWTMTLHGRVITGGALRASWS